jgi:hypothetical protein
LEGIGANERGYDPGGGRMQDDGKRPGGAGGLEGALGNLAGENVWSRGSEESGNEKVGRIEIEILGGTELLEGAGIEESDSVRDGDSFGLIVRDVDGCDPKLLLDRANDRAELLAAERIEIGEGLIEEKDSGMGGEGAGERDALLLTAGKRCGLAREEIGDAEQLGQFHDAVVDLWSGNAAEFWAEGDVLLDSELREEGGVLESHSHGAVLGRFFEE